MKHAPILLPSYRNNRTGAHARRGVTLIEMMVVLAILTIALSMFSRTLVSSTRLDPVNRETVAAAEAARGQLEEMRNHPFVELFARYNDQPADDPGGFATAPGATFTVDGLEPLPGRSYVGTVVFPAVQGELREDVEDVQLGTPRDLNGDGEVDGDDHADDAIVVPTLVRLEWQGRSGQRALEMYTIFADQ